MNPKPLRWEWASAKQAAAFHHPEDRPLLLVGGQGSGKTVVNCRKIIAYLLKYPRSRFLIVRRVFKQLQRTVAKTFYSELPPQYIKTQNKSDGSCVLLNDSEVIFLHLEQEASVSALLSLEINGVFLNECVEIDEKHVDMVQRRLGRWTKAEVPHAGPDWKWRTAEGKPIPPPMFLADSNPDDGDDQHWMVKRFYEDNPARHDKTIPEVGKDGLPTGRMLCYKDLGYDLIEMPSYENRFLPLENLQQLYASGEIERFVEGKRGSRRGKIHIIHPDSLVPGSEAVLSQIRMRCRLSRVLDHGTTAPTCCTWWGADADGNVYCVAPETKVLTADLRWVEIGSVEVGDDLVGFEEESSKADTPRRYQRATVEAAERVQKPCYRLTLSDGAEIVCSEDHLWLVQAQGGVNLRWQKTSDLASIENGRPSHRTGKRTTKGDKLVRLLNPWGPDTSYGAGYLAGAFDGEGCYSVSDGSPGITLGQKDNELLARVTGELTSKGLRFSSSKARGYGYSFTNLAITRKRDMLRLLGSIRPERLLRRFDPDRFGVINAIDHPEVVRKEFIGMTEVVALKTSSRTFIAEGLASHNCYREYYQADKLISYHRDAIFEHSRGEQYVENLADPSIFAKTMRRNNENRCTWSVADEYMDRGMYKPATAIPWTRAENTELGTRNRINEYLRWDEAHVNPFTNKRGSPRVFFILQGPGYPLGCVHVHRETALQRHVEEADGTFSTERDPDVVDHAYDTLRYYIAARTPVKFAKPGYPKGSIGYDILENERRQRQLDRAEVSYGL